MKKLDLDGGKYTVIYGEGKQEALRYGEEWRDLTGDNLVFWLLAEIEDLKDRLALIDANHSIENNKCKALQMSDQMVCNSCDLVWDMNDYFPPQCGIVLP